MLLVVGFGCAVVLFPLLLVVIPYHAKLLECFSLLIGECLLYAILFHLEAHVVDP